MDRYLRKIGRYALLALPLTIVFAVACGSDTVTTVVETVIVEKQVVVEKEVPVEVEVEKIVEVVRTVVVTEQVEKIIVATAIPAKVVAPVRTDDRFGGALTVALGAAISTLDVHRTTGTTASEVAYVVQERLLAYNADLIATPLLMDTWEVSDDGMQWTFKLRSGIKFHNGVPLTAEHAVNSWLRWAERDKSRCQRHDPGSDARRARSQSRRDNQQTSARSYETRI